MRFKTPSAKLVKEVPLDPSKLVGGFRALMTPVDLTGKCRNPTCGGTKHHDVGCGIRQISSSVFDNPANQL